LDQHVKIFIHITQSLFLLQLCCLLGFFFPLNKHFMKLSVPMTNNNMTYLLIWFVN
jgi:hypothetical protein